MTASVSAVRQGVRAASNDADRHGAELLAKLLRGQRSGKGVLPFFLGLQPLELIYVVQRYLAGEFRAADVVQTQHGADDTAWQRGELRQQLLDLRRDEWNDLMELLLRHCAGGHPLDAIMAKIVAAACLGGDHLWRDLGLDSRSELSDLMNLFFPQLAQKNDRDMKWKKFFYKQLCEREGSYVCRAPSCEECAAFEDCFGEET